MKLKDQRMSRLVLSTILAILGSIIAEVLRQGLELEKAWRFAIVVGAFVICLVVSYRLTGRKRSSDSEPRRPRSLPCLRVHQKATTLESDGTMVGLDGDNGQALPLTSVEQEVESVRGELIGKRVRGPAKVHPRYQDDHDRRP